MNEYQKKIVELMQAAGLNMDTCERALSYLETTAQQTEMIKFLEQNQGISAMHIMARVKELTINI